MKRLADRRIDDSIHNVVGYKCIDYFSGVSHRRHGKQQNCSQCVRYRQPQNPDTGLSVLGMRPVNNRSHQYIRKSVKHSRQQHDHPHRSCRYSHHIRIEIYQQRRRHGIHQCQCRITEAIGQLLSQRDFYEFIHIPSPLSEIQ